MQSRFGSTTNNEEEVDVKKHKPLAKISEQAAQNIKQLEQDLKNRNHGSGAGESKKLDIRDYLNDEQKK